MRNLVNGLAFTCLLLTEISFAAENKSVLFGLGTISRGLTKVSQKASGDSNFFGPQYYPFTLQTFFDIGPSWHFGPYLGYTVLGNMVLPKKSPEGGQTTSILMIGLPIFRDVGGGNSFDWNFGPTFLMTTIQGAGGTVVLENGSSTATFGLPAKAQKSMNIGVQLGLGYMTDSFRVELDMITEGILSSNRRTFSLFLLASYKIF